MAGVRHGDGGAQQALTTSQHIMEEGQIVAHLHLMYRAHWDGLNDLRAGERDDGQGGER